MKSSRSFLFSLKAGQERFRSVTHSYYRDANALLLLYDVTAITSFNNVRAWLSDVREYAHQDVIVMLIANKVDRTSERVVTRDMGEKLASEYDVTYIETSAKTGLNVEFCFKAIGQALLQQADASASNGLSASQTLNTLVQLNHRSSQRSLCCSFS
jgi:Ras-related protein Rab-37